jgi:hypothetical protein
MEPRFKNLKFKSDSDFEEWLKKHTKYKIMFEDCGQDFLVWHLDESGEVLHSSPFQSSIWNGQFVNVSKMDVGKFPELLGDQIRTVNYRLISIEKFEL